MGFKDFTAPPRLFTNTGCMSLWDPSVQGDKPVNRPLPTFKGTRLVIGSCNIADRIRSARGSGDESMVFDVYEIIWNLV